MDILNAPSTSMAVTPKIRTMTYVDYRGERAVTRAMESNTKTSDSTKPDELKRVLREIHDSRSSKNDSLVASKPAYEYDNEFKAWVLRILNSDDELIRQIPLEITLKLQRMMEHYERGDIIDVLA